MTADPAPPGVHLFEAAGGDRVVRLPDGSEVGEIRHAGDEQGPAARVITFLVRKGVAYWFTSSTSFAKSAVTVGRAFTDTFAEIAPVSVTPFIAAHLVGAAVGAFLDDRLEGALVGPCPQMDTSIQIGPRAIVKTCGSQC